MQTCTLPLASLPAYQWVPALFFSLASVFIVLAAWLYQHIASARSSKALAAYQVSVAYIEKGTLFDEVGVATKEINETDWQGRFVDCEKPLIKEYGYEPGYPYNYALFFACTVLADPQAGSSITAATPANEKFRFLNRARRQLSMFWRGVISLNDSRQLPSSFFVDSAHPWVSRGNDYRDAFEPLDLAHFVVVDHLQQRTGPSLDPDEIFDLWQKARAVDGPYLPHSRLQQFFPRSRDDLKFDHVQQREFVHRLIAMRAFQLDTKQGGGRLRLPLLERAPTPPASPHPSPHPSPQRPAPSPQRRQQQQQQQQ